MPLPMFRELPPVPGHILERLQTFAALARWGPTRTPHTFRGVGGGLEVFAAHLAHGEYFVAVGLGDGTGLAFASIGADPTMERLYNAARIAVEV